MSKNVKFFNIYKDERLKNTVKSKYKYTGSTLLSKTKTMGEESIVLYHKKVNIVKNIGT